MFSTGEALAFEALWTLSTTSEAFNTHAHTSQTPDARIPDKIDGQLSNTPGHWP